MQLQGAVNNDVHKVNAGLESGYFVWAGKSGLPWSETVIAPPAISKKEQRSEM